MRTGIGVRDKGGGHAVRNTCTGRKLEEEAANEGGCNIGGNGALRGRHAYTKRSLVRRWPEASWKIGERLSGLSRRYHDLRARQEGQSPDPSLAPILDITTDSTQSTTPAGLGAEIGLPRASVEVDSEARLPVRSVRDKALDMEIVPLPQVPAGTNQDDTQSILRTTSDQLVLSPTPPPSPIDSGVAIEDSFLTPNPSAIIPVPGLPPGSSSTNLASSNLAPSPVLSHTTTPYTPPLPSPSASPTQLPPTEDAPVVTITSYLMSTTTGAGPTKTNTTTETQWMYYTTTIPGTVFVYASLIDGKSATRSTNITTTSSTMLSTSSQSISSPPPTSTFVLTPNTGGGYNGKIGNNPVPDPPKETSIGSGNDSSIPTPKIVGGIIGGVACIVLFAWVIILLIRRHKQKMVINRRVEAGYGGPLPEPPMVERSSAVPIAHWGFGSFGRNSRQSAASEPVSEERGFYKVSGRKLPPAIGGPRPDMPAHNSSFYQEEENRWLGGPRTVTPVASPTSSRPSRYSGGTQTSASPTASGFPSGNTPFGLSFTAPPPVPPPPQSQPQYQPHYTNPFLSPTHEPSTPGRIPEEYGAEEYQGEIDRERERANTPRMSVQRSRDFTPTSMVHSRDGLGRSLPSLDGSRTSRFTEDIV